MSRSSSLRCAVLSVAFSLLVLTAESTIAHADSVGMTVELREYRLSPDLLSKENSCPSSQAFQSEVSSLLGRSPFSSDNPAMRIEVNIKKTENHYSGTLGSTDSSSSRSFKAPTCPELSSTIALAIAIAIDPFFVPPPYEPPKDSDNTLPNPPPEKTESSTVGSPDKPVPAIVDKPAPLQRSPSSKIRWSTSLQPSVSIGLTPAVSGGIALGTSLHLGKASMELSLTATTRGQEDFAMGALDAQVFYASFLPCWSPANYSICGSMSIGSLRARGLAPLQDREIIQRIHSALGFRFLLSLLDTRRFQMRWFIDAQARITRTTLTVENDQAWSTPGAFVLSGLKFTLPLQ